jgi:hypothetical protein
MYFVRMIYIGFCAEFLALSNETIRSLTNTCLDYLSVKIRSFCGVEIQCGIPRRGSLTEFSNGLNMS